jgi:hypothetical protein
VTRFGDTGSARKCHAPEDGKHSETTAEAGWKARDSRKRSRRSPEALTAGGPTLRGWHDLLNVRSSRELTSGVNFRRHRPSQQIAASIAR